MHFVYSSSSHTAEHTHSAECKTHVRSHTSVKNPKQNNKTPTHLHRHSGQHKKHTQSQVPQLETQDLEGTLQASPPPETHTHTHLHSTLSSLPLQAWRGNPPPNSRYHAHCSRITEGDCTTELQAMRLNYAILCNKLDKSAPDVGDYVCGEAADNRKLGGGGLFSLYVNLWPAHTLKLRMHACLTALWGPRFHCIHSFISRKWSYFKAWFHIFP